MTGLLVKIRDSLTLIFVVYLILYVLYLILSFSEHLKVCSVAKIDEEYRKTLSK